MAADLMIGQRFSRLGALLHNCVVSLRQLRRGKPFTGAEAERLEDALVIARREVSDLHGAITSELCASAEQLEAADLLLRRAELERGVHFNSGDTSLPQPAAFEGLYVPEPDKPEYLRDMAQPTNVVILASVRRSRPEGGAR